jgi:AraC-like DNA-binding protein
MRAGAQLLIEQPAIPVRDVAHIVGYSQPPHFAKAFRRRYGLTPAAFRAEGLAYARRSRGRSRTAVTPPTALVPCRNGHTSSRTTAG